MLVFFLNVLFYAIAYFVYCLAEDTFQAVRSMRETKIHDEKKKGKQGKKVDRETLNHKHYFPSSLPFRARSLPVNVR